MTGASFKASCAQVVEGRTEVTVEAGSSVPSVVLDVVDVVSGLLAAASDSFANSANAIGS